MNEAHLLKLRELSLLLDLAYLHYFGEDNLDRYLKSAEASIRVDFGNYWYRKNHPTRMPNGPEIEQIVIYSSVFSAGRVCYFDTLDDAMLAVEGWYQTARARQH